MPRPGGEAGKLGDQYEGFWTVDQLIELCLGRATNICIEEVGTEAEGVEFHLVREDGVSEYHSVKRQRSDGEWTLARLTTPSATGRSILGDLFKKLRENSTARCVFLSATGANDLREACEAAGKCDTADQFEQLIQGMGPLRRELKDRLVSTTTLAEWTEVHGLLRRIRVVLKDPATLRADVEERLLAYFARSDLSAIQTADERRALGELVMDRLGVPLSAQAVLGFLESRGVVRRDSLAQPDVRQKVEESVEHYLRVVNGDLVNGGSIPRDEADVATAQLLDSTHLGGVLIAANAGFGKSCVLAQIIAKLRTEVPTLVVRFDELEAIRSTVELGAALGFDASPVMTLAGIAGPRPCVFIVDQLDAVSELSGRKSTLWDIFERLRSESLRFPKMKFLVACRSFDLEHDHRLRRLTAKESGFTQVKLGLLPVSTVDNALSAAGIDAALVSGGEKELLRVPLHLHLFLISYERGQKPIATRQDLFDRFWATKEVRVRNRCDGECHWQDVIDALVRNMSTRAALTAVDDVVAAWTKTVDAMASEHVLVRDGRRIRFFHESFVDYAFARGFSARGESLVEFLAKTDQGLFYRSLVRQVLTQLRDDDRTSYLQTLQALLKDGRIRFHLKVLVLDWMSSLVTPTEDEWRLVDELSRVPEFGDRAFWVIRNSTAWFDLLDGLGVLAGWMTSSHERLRNRFLWLISATKVHEHRSSAIARLLRAWIDDEQRRSTLLSAIVEQDVWRSIEMQTLFLDLLPEIIALPAQPARHHDWWDVIHDAVKHDPSFVLKCVTLWIDGLIDAWAPDTEHSRFFDRDDVTQRASMALRELAKSRPIDFASMMLPRILQIIKLTAYNSNDGLIADRTWHARAASDFLGMDGGVLESAIVSLELLAKESPEELDKLINGFAGSAYESVIYILLRVWMSQPEKYAAELLSLLCDRPETFDIGYTSWSKGNPTYAISREAMGKCLPFWTEDQIARLERTMQDFVPWPDATQEQINWHRHLLLSAIEPMRMTDDGKRRWLELHAMFPDEDLRLPGRHDSGFVGSPIPPEDTSRFTDEQWLDAMRKHNTDWSGPRRHGFGTAVELSRVLQKQVEAEPERFAALAVQMDDSIHPLYFSAIMSGVCPLNPPPKGSAAKPFLAETAKVVIRRVHALPNRPCGKEVAHAFSCFDDCELEPPLLDVLEHYAIFDPDPSEDIWMKTAGSDKRYYGGDAYMAGYNSVRGSAARSIGHLLYDRRDLLNRFLPVLERLVSDQQLSVRACAIDALLPLLNFDRETAVRLFSKACEGADAILGTHPVDRFHYWASDTHYDVLRPILLEALHSEDEEAVDSASRQICLASYKVAAAESDVPIILGGTETMRKAAAKVFSTNLKVPFCRDRCLALLPTLFTDGSADVRAVASECWHGFTKDDLLRDEQLIECYVESDAFPSRHDHLIHQLEETHAPLPAIIVKMAERFLSAIRGHLGEAAHPAVYESSTIATLVIRLYSQTHDSELRVKCLNLIDEMAKLRIDVDRQLAEHDR